MIEATYFMTIGNAEILAKPRNSFACGLLVVAKRSILINVPTLTKSLSIAVWKMLKWLIHHFLQGSNPDPPKSKQIPLFVARSKWLLVPFSTSCWAHVLTSPLLLPSLHNMQLTHLKSTLTRHSTFAVTS
ncbi:hypothetical protein HHX47_DHR8000252 [Lentinula edodes]|nr:hypothetical protein HHX47_DHR8000252 [Lentinula edodes]